VASVSERDLDPNGSYRSAMRSLIGARFGAVWKAVPVAIDGSDPEGVHDVRVASRRLRAAMDVAVECFPQDWYAALHAVAKEITDELGEVRDRDVLLGYLEAERDRVARTERAGIDRLIARVSRERDAAREAMIAYLGRLEAAKVAEESVRRFGREAVAPWMDDGEDGDES
jgi:triphosphatase